MDNFTSLSTFDWGSVSTEAFLAVSALITLIGAAFSGDERGGWPSVFAMFAMIASLLVTYFGPFGSAPELTDSSNFGIFVTACALLTGLMSFSYFAKGAKRRSEFLAVLMICTAALNLFVRSNNLMFAFVSLECATVCLYVMASWTRDAASSLEAGAKYLVASGVSGAIFLMGVAFIYGAGVSTDIDFINFENFSRGLSNPMFGTGLVLVCSGVLFKIAAFPFQFWSPDVYQGAPTPASAFFAVASKAAGILFLGRICSGLDFSVAGAAGLQGKAVLAISVIAALTILIGNLGGITQINVKRLMAFSGISNAGYMLVLITAVLKYSSFNASFETLIYFYLAAYMFANYALFFVVNQFDTVDDSDQTFADYRGLSRRSAVLESALIVNLSSLAGIPPTAGFFGKIVILIVAWYAELYWLMGVMIFGSVVSIYYYFSWMRASLDVAHSNEKSPRRAMPAGPLAPTIVALTAASLIFGFTILYYFNF